MNTAQVQIRVLHAAGQPVKEMRVDGVVCPHLEAAELCTFTLIAGVVLSGIPEATAGALHYYLKGKPYKAIVDELQHRATSHGNRNPWQAALYRALATSPWYVKSGYLNEMGWLSVLTSRAGPDRPGEQGSEAQGRGEADLVPSPSGRSRHMGPLIHLPDRAHRRRTGLRRTPRCDGRPVAR
ncbi:hypothetical protein WEB32_34360 [Streptomyces netropsis]|uniref:hypothetical protein n=1 Tax=Streptomyces netropsis TaxID=55404 RepID=UPI0030D140BE